MSFLKNAVLEPVKNDTEFSNVWNNIRYGYYVRKLSDNQLCLLWFMTKDAVAL